ncbi:hypothetical protein V5799_032119 [Amblyomma americanum]|uniref:Alpha-latrotoxin n=1 Tax=Amblyomma americanum TaxID=6943 RepID=A0AAQ4DS43_AMBAM
MPLHLAAHKGHRSLVRLLLTAGAPRARGDARGRTPLHFSAAQSPSTGVLATLLGRMDAGQVDIRDALKQTALHKSALACQPENMAALLKRGANPLMQDAEGRTSLHLCAASSRPAALACCRLLLDWEPTLAAWQDYQGCTPLHMAVASGSLTVIDLLTQRGGREVNTADNLFRAPLHWAVILGRLQAAKILMDRGADASLGDQAGVTPLLYACSCASAEQGKLVALLLSRYGGAAPLGAALRTASLAGCVAAVRALRHHAAALDKETVAAAMTAAASRGHLDVLQLLLDLQGGSAFDGYVLTGDPPALMAAACSGHTHCLLALLDAGATGVHCTDSEGRTALHWAVVGDQACLCRLLIQRGCAVNAADNHGSTALHYASSRGSAECADVLLQANADPNLLDAQGRTPLHWAARCGSLPVARLLRERGALLSVPDHTSCRATALDEASGHRVLHGWMRLHGALDIQDIRHAAAVVIQRWFRAVLSRKRHLKPRLPRGPSVQSCEQKEFFSASSIAVPGHEKDSAEKAEVAARIIQCAWRRWVMQRRVFAVAADEDAWNHALAHLNLFTGCCCPDRHS